MYLSTFLFVDRDRESHHTRHVTCIRNERRGRNPCSHHKDRKIAWEERKRREDKKENQEKSESTSHQNNAFFLFFSLTNPRKYISSIWNVAFLSLPSVGFSSPTSFLFSLIKWGKSSDIYQLRERKETSQSFVGSDVSFTDRLTITFLLCSSSSSLSSHFIIPLLF